MAVQLNVNVSGYNPQTDEKPTLINDDQAHVSRVELAFDSNSTTRGNFRWSSPPPAGGWTLLWGPADALQSRRVWISENYQEAGDHPSLPDGWTNEAAVLGDGKEVGFPPTLIYVVVPETLPDITIQGLDFLAGGQRLLVNGILHYLALLNILLGQEPIDYDYGNFIRVALTMVAIPGQIGLPPLDPDAFSNYWDGVRALYQWATSKGKYVAWSVCDMGMLGKSDAWLQSFLAAFASVFPTQPGLFLGRNEGWNSVNGSGYLPHLPIAMPQCGGSTQDASGSYGYDDPGAAAGQIYDVHPRRDIGNPPEYKMLTHANLSAPRRQYNKIVVIGEHFKAGTVVLDGKQYNDPDFFRSQGAAFKAANGGFFNSFNSDYSRPLDGVEQACWEAFQGL